MKISSREKKILIAGSVAAVLTGLFYFSDQLVPSSGQRATLETKKKMLAQYRETIAAEQNYKARLEYDRRRYESSQARLLPGENASIAAAELMKILTELAGPTGVEITRRDVLQTGAKLRNDLIKIEVKIETNCNPEQLVQFIAAVENYERFLTISDLTVSAYKMQKKSEIRPSLTVAGYIMAPEAKVETKAGAKAG